MENQTINTCEYCNEIDTLEHHSFGCKHTKIFWSRIQNWTKKHLDTSIEFTVCEILFGIGIENNDSFNIINFLILLGKTLLLIGHETTENRSTLSNSLRLKIKLKTSYTLNKKSLKKTDNL